MWLPARIPVCCLHPLALPISPGRLGLDGVEALVGDVRG